jgi:hypothetical protein
VPEENSESQAAVSNQVPKTNNSPQSIVQNKDAQGEESVKCRFCLGKPIRLSSLSNHVIGKHENFVNDEGRRSYIAEPMQKIPDDPAF